VSRVARCQTPRSAFRQIPYRASNLTRVLRDCFEDECHLTSVLAAVSPAAASTIHTLNTMDHVLLTSKTLKATSFEVNLPCVDTSKGCGYDGVPVHQWTSEQLIEWISNAEGGRFAQARRQDAVPRTVLSARAGAACARASSLATHARSARLRPAADPWSWACRGRQRRLLAWGLAQ